MRSSDTISDKLIEFSVCIYPKKSLRISVTCLCIITSSFNKFTDNDGKNGLGFINHITFSHTDGNFIVHIKYLRYFLGLPLEHVFYDYALIS